VAVFDLDGTITYHDTLVPYLVHALRHRPTRAWRLWTLPGALLRFCVTRDRGVLKSQLIRAVLGGLSRAEVDQLGAQFLDERLAQLTRRGALRALDRHRQRGDHLVLLSASVDLYVPMIGTRLGFHESICTGITWRGDRLSGELSTANRHGVEKTQIIKALQARHPQATIAAYGNAQSDLDHLAHVNYPTVVNANRRTRAKAQALGLAVDHWR
jgi:phosphatidylglycerophosphatase C